MAEDGLPIKGARFNVVAPEGGFSRQFRSLELGHRVSLDILVEGLDGLSFWLRLVPVPGEIAPDPERDQVRHINKAIATYIDEDGHDILGYPPVEVNLNLNLEVQARGMPAGTLTMFPYPLDLKQLGA